MVCDHVISGAVMLGLMFGKILLVHAAFDLSTPHSSHPSLRLILLHAAAISTLTNDPQLVSPPSTAHLFFSSPHIYFSPGFSGDPEDLLPDIDLKIMPGRGVMHSTPYLAPSFHTNSC